MYERANLLYTHTNKHNLVVLKKLENVSTLMLIEVESKKRTRILGKKEDKGINLKQQFG